MEANCSDGPWPITAERVVAYVDGSQMFDPRFYGLYVQGSRVRTGQSSHYGRTKGVPGRIIPLGRWGAPKAVARYAMMDLDDGSVRGGRFRRLELGACWWATSRAEVGMLYGTLCQVGFGSTGTTRWLLMYPVG